MEHDTMGEVRVPASARWGAQTQRAVENFPVSGQPLPPELIHALARIKGAAAQANAQLGVLDLDVAEAIAAAAAEVVEGRYDDQFPIDVFQTGSGTSSNMNMNEVLERRDDVLDDGRRSRDVHRGRHRVVARLRGVDVVVGVDRPAHRLRRQVGDDLVRVHVRAGA